MPGEHGFAWPWESLEALASFDCRLKGRDLGILERHRIRYVLPQAGMAPRRLMAASGRHVKSACLVHGRIVADHEGHAGSRTVMTLGAGLGSAHNTETEPAIPSTWTSPPLGNDLDVFAIFNGNSKPPNAGLARYSKPEIEMGIAQTFVKSVHLLAFRERQSSPSLSW
jgi:hypothetical protein